MFLVGDGHCYGSGYGQGYGDGYEYGYGYGDGHGSGHGRGKIMTFVPECRECGACCTDPHSEEIADVEEWEACHISSRARTNGIVETSRGFLATRAVDCRLTRGRWSGASTMRCYFLRGTVGSRCSCRIYANRPAVCSEFRRGGTLCDDALNEIGELSSNGKAGA